MPKTKKNCLEIVLYDLLSYFKKCYATTPKTNGKGHSNSLETAKVKKQLAQILNGTFSPAIELPKTAIQTIGIIDSLYLLVENLIESLELDDQSECILQKITSQTDRLFKLAFVLICLRNVEHRITLDFKPIQQFDQKTHNSIMHKIEYIVFFIMQHTAKLVADDKRLNKFGPVNYVELVIGRWPANDLAIYCFNQYKLPERLTQTNQEPLALVFPMLLQSRSKSVA